MKRKNCPPTLPKGKSQSFTGSTLSMKKLQYTLGQVGWVRIKEIPDLSEPLLFDRKIIVGDVGTPGTVGELLPLEFLPDLEDLELEDPELEDPELEGPELDPPDFDPLLLLTVGARVVMAMVEKMTSDTVPTQSSPVARHVTMTASPTSINSSPEPACKYLLVAPLPVSKTVASPVFTSASVALAVVTESSSVLTPPTNAFTVSSSKIVSTSSITWFGLKVGAIVGLKTVGRSVGGFVGGSVGGFVGGFVGRFVGRLVGGFVGRLVGGFVGRLVGGFVGGLVGRSVGGFVGGSVGGFVGGFVGRFVGGFVGAKLGAKLGTVEVEGMADVDGTLVGTVEVEGIPEGAPLGTVDGTLVVVGTVEVEGMPEGAME
eukprot:scaffold69974_cov51-Attheya_sp.AAC.2